MRRRKYPKNYTLDADEEAAQNQPKRISSILSGEYPTIPPLGKPYVPYSKDRRLNLRPKIIYTYDDLSISHILYFINNLDWVYWNYDMDLSQYPLLEDLSFQYPLERFYVYGSTRWGRTTSAIADEDSSFYLWKWFTTLKPLRPTGGFKKSGIKYERRFPKNHFFFIGEQFSFVRDRRLRNVKKPRRQFVPELQNTHFKDIIFSFRKPKILYDILPKRIRLKKIGRRKWLRKKLSGSDWISWLNPYIMSKFPFGVPYLKYKPLVAFENQYRDTSNFFQDNFIDKKELFTKGPTIWQRGTLPAEHFPNLFPFATPQRLYTYITKQTTRLIHKPMMNPCDNIGPFKIPIKETKFPKDLSFIYQGLMDQAVLVGKSLKIFNKVHDEAGDKYVKTFINPQMLRESLIGRVVDVHKVFLLDSLQDFTTLVGNSTNRQTPKTITQYKIIKDSELFWAPQSIILIP